MLGDSVSIVVSAGDHHPLPFPFSIEDFDRIILIPDNDGNISDRHMAFVDSIRNPPVYSEGMRYRINFSFKESCNASWMFIGDHEVELGPGDCIVLDRMV